MTRRCEVVLPRRYKETLLSQVVYGGMCLEAIHKGALARDDVKGSLRNTPQRRHRPPRGLHEVRSGPRGWVLAPGQVELSRKHLVQIHLLWRYFFRVDIERDGCDGKNKQCIEDSTGNIQCEGCSTLKDLL